MKVDISYFDIIILGVYFLAIILIGLYYGKEKFTFRSFTLGNKRFSTRALVATISVTIIGGNSVIGISEQVNKVGWIILIVLFCDVVRMVVSARFIAPRFKKFPHALTLGDIFVEKYGKLGKIFVGLLGTLYTLTILGAQIAALSYICSYIVGVEKFYATLFSMSIVILYTTVGGIKSVVYTDILQFLILIIMLSIMLYFCVDSNHINLIEKGFHVYDKDFPYISLSIAFLIPYVSPDLAQRFLMAKDENQASHSFFIASIFHLPLYVIVGIFALSIKFGNPSVPADQTFFYALDNFVPIGIKGFLIAGLAAITMSTADSMLNCASTTFVHDVIKPLYWKKLLDRTSVKLARLFTIILGFSALLVTMNFKTVMEIIIASQYLWIPTVLIPILSILFNFSIKKKLLPYPIIGALLIIIFWKIFDLKSVFHFDSIVPAILVNLIVFALCYIFPKNHKMSRLHKIIKNMKSWVLKIYYKVIHSSIRYKFFNVVTPFSHIEYDIFAIFSLLMSSFGIFLHKSPAFSSPFIFVLTAQSIIFSFLILLRRSFLSYQKFIRVLWKIFICYNFCLYPSLLAYLSDFDYATVLNFVTCLILLFSLLSPFVFLYLNLCISLPVFFLYIIEHWGEIYISKDTTRVVSAFLCFLFGNIALILRFAKIKMERRIEGMKILAGSIAHEMRTPFAALNSSMNFLKELNGTDKLASEHISQSLSVIQRANNTITLVLSNMKKDFGAMKQESKDLNVIAGEIIKSYSFLESEKDFFSFEPDDEDCFVSLDSMLTEQVVFNLLKNAIFQRKKHGKGNIILKVRKNTLIVEDTVIGLKESFMKNMFNTLVSGESTGTGLGLAFCKLVMEKMDGSITCESEYLKYTRFVLKFKPSSINNVKRKGIEI